MEFRARAWTTSCFSSVLRIASLACKESQDMGFRFTVKKNPYDASYIVGEATRSTTNFANFVRDPKSASQSIETFLSLVNADFNRLQCSEASQRYEIRLEVLSLYIHSDDHGRGSGILLTEALQAHVFDRQTTEVFPGPTGLNFSSYLRDYDFRIVLPRLLQGKATAQEWNAFGKLHGMLTRRQFGSCGLIAEPLAVAISLAEIGRAHV